MKRIGGIFAAALSAAAGLCLTANAAETADGKISYERAGGEVTITRYRWLDEERVQIPETIEGEPVTKIAAHAFPYCYADEIILPQTVTQIGEGAFEGCAYLKTMELPQNLIAVGAGAFSDCEALEAVEIPETVESVGAGAFAGTPFLKNMPNGPVILGTGILCAYQGECPETLVLPEGIERVADGALAGEENLRNLTLPKTLLNIGKQAFKNCTNLSQITCDGALESIGAEAFAGTEWGEREGFAVLGGVLYGYRGGEAILTVPDGVRMIHNEAFRGQKNLASVTLPKTVEKIGAGAFADCETLQAADLGGAVQVIGASAFENCPLLKYVNFGYALKTIGAGAFLDCPALAQAHLPDSLETIGEQAFGFVTDESGETVRAGEIPEIYANAQAAKDYAQAQKLNISALPEEENTKPAVTVSAAAGVTRNWGTPRGEAWIPGAMLGALLAAGALLALPFAQRGKK